MQIKQIGVWKSRLFKVWTFAFSFWLWFAWLSKTAASNYSIEGSKETKIEETMPRLLSHQLPFESGGICFSGKFEDWNVFVFNIRLANILTHP